MYLTKVELFKLEMFRLKYQNTKKPLLLETSYCTQRMCIVYGMAQNYRQFPKYPVSWVFIFSAFTHVFFTGQELLKKNSTLIILPRRAKRFKDFNYIIF